jgi:hypothetical protein
MPAFASSLWRRERAWALGAGFCAGAAIAGVVRHLILGSAINQAIFISYFSPAAVPVSAPFYAFVLLGLVPGGLIAVAAYKGAWRRELQATVALQLTICLFYLYSGQDSGPIERIAVAGRYFIPLLPMMTIAWADVASRHLQRLRPLVPAACVALCIAAFSVHPVMHAWSVDDAKIARDIVSTAAGGTVIVSTSQRKYVSPIYGPMTRVWTVDAPPDRLAELAPQPGEIYLVLVSRTETAAKEEVWAFGAQSYVASVRDWCQLEPVRDQWYGSHRRLRMWRVRACDLTSRTDQPIT